MISIYTDRHRLLSRSKALAAGALIFAGLAGTASMLWPTTEAAAQPIPLRRILYLGKFICGGQVALNPALQSPPEAGRLEQGSYSTNFSVFNSGGSNTTVGVTVSTPTSGGPVAVLPPLNIPSLGTAVVDCSDIYNALNVPPLNNALVGTIQISRMSDDLDVQAAYTARTFGGDGVRSESVSVDVERVPGREFPLVLRRL